MKKSKNDNERRTLRILQPNCRSLLATGKRSEIARLAHAWKVDILCLQETHFQKSDRTPRIQGFKLVGRCDRDADYGHRGGRGGGVATYQRNDLNIDLLTDKPIQKGIDRVTVLVRSPKGPLSIANVYVPPPLHASEWYKFVDDHDMVVADGNMCSSWSQQEQRPLELRSKII